MLAELETQNPGVKRQMLAALRNVKPAHLLDTELWKKLGLFPSREGGAGFETDEVVG